jgi:hypothetical protein
LVSLKKVDLMDSRNYWLVLLLFIFGLQSIYFYLTSPKPEEYINFGKLEFLKKDEEGICPKCHNRFWVFIGDDVVECSCTMEDEECIE